MNSGNIRFTFDVQRTKRYSSNDTELPRQTHRCVARGDRVPVFGAFASQASKRLEILNAATSLDDLHALRGNSLEALKGDRSGQYSIRINKQWRICFRWPRGTAGPQDVEIVDYH